MSGESATEAGLRLARAPLKLALVQVRFSPIRKMADFVPDLQEYFRLNGYPHFDEETIQQIHVAKEKVQTHTRMRWSFLDADRRHAIILTDDFVVFSTNEYNDFEEFVQRVRPILAELKAVTSVSLVTQIGLRYVDVIEPLDGHSPSWFLQRELRGLTKQSIAVEGIHDVVNMCVLEIKTILGTLIFRGFETKDKLAMPPDLRQTPLEFQDMVSSEDPYRVLDFDHIWKGSMEFDSEQILSRMDELKRPISSAFRAAVTEEAIEVWNSNGGQR